MGLVVLDFFIVCLTSIWQDHIWLLRASCVLDSIPTSDPLSIFYNMMFGGSVLHINQTSSGRNLSLIEHLRRLVLILVLERIKQLVCCILGSLDLFHFFPDLLDVQVHHIILVLQVYAVNRALSCLVGMRSVTLAGLNRYDWWSLIKLRQRLTLRGIDFLVEIEWVGEI
jgi:hypothetical protein